MFGKNDIEAYFKNNAMDDAISIHAIKGVMRISKKILADSFLQYGIALRNKNLRETINPKGLVDDLQDIERTITKESYITGKDTICNVVIGTPQVIKDKDKDVFLGYSRDNLSGYSTAVKQEDFECMMTKAFETEGRIPSEFIVGYYYEDGKEKYFEENKSYYSLLSEEEKEEINEKLFEQFGRKEKDIDSMDQEVLLSKMHCAIEANNADSNPAYIRAEEYLEYKSKKNNKVKKVMSKPEFLDMLRSKLNNYSIYIHGVDQEPNFSKTVTDQILRSCLHLDEFYGASGTLEPKGLVRDKVDLDRMLDYHYGDNKEKSFNIIFAIPQTLTNIKNEEFYLGYSRENTTGTFPKSMQDFDCILTDILNDKDYVPKEFIIGYKVYGPNMEDKFYINKNHISFKDEELRKVFTSKFLKTDNEALKEKIKLFKKQEDDDYLYPVAHPVVLVRNNKIPSVVTTAKEYFEEKEYKEKQDKIKQKVYKKFDN